MKNLNKVLFAAFAALLMTGLACPAPASETDSVSGAESEPAVETEYTAGLFDAGFVHTVDVSISESDWEDLLAHPADKTKYEADVVIDGEMMESVSFAAKGSVSLLFVADDPESSRYSFKINFGKYVKGQTWHGLDKLNLQNVFSDATYMKDYLSYGLFRRMKVAAPLTAYVWLTVNGEDRGLYLAVEEMETGFLERAFSGEGSLYKPETESRQLTEEERLELKDGADLSPVRVNGADLVYTDDLPEHYSDIFNNAAAKSDEDAQKRVITALKGLSEGNDPAEYLDTEEIIRYFAVQNYLMNYDSYTGTNLHNYYLYEKDGKLAMLPWDYNMAFGAFPADGRITMENDSSLVVNYGIDTPLAGVSEEERPMWSWIVSDEAYLEEYHEVMDELITENFDSGWFESEIRSLRDMILPYVEKDPTAFYTAEQFEQAAETLLAISQLRAESIRRQLDGRLSAETDLQTENDRVDASGIVIRDMGVLLG